MRFARFNANGKTAYGIVEQEHVKEISGSPLTQYTETGINYDIADITLISPVKPQKIFAMALNYGSHLHGAKRPARPEPFNKTHTSVIGPNETIVVPRDSEKVDAESELVVVIGNTAKNVSEADALNYVFGYTCGNDVSARDWQANDTSWWRAKSSDTFSPLGPWIETDLDPTNVDITGRINGEVVQECNTREMIFGVAATIAYISKYVTLEPEDCIFTGTSGTAGQITAGNIVEVDIAGIGILRNRVA